MAKKRKIDESLAKHLDELADKIIPITNNLRTPMNPDQIMAFVTNATALALSWRKGEVVSVEGEVFPGSGPH